MTNVFDGRWQVFGPAGTNYTNFFQSLANVGSQSGSPTSYVVTYNDLTSIEYSGAGLSYDGGLATLSGVITGVTIRNSLGVVVAALTATSDNPFRIDSGALIHSGSAFFDQILSGDNLVIGSTNGSGGTPEVLDGRGGSDTFRPGNGHTNLIDAVGASTLDLSALTGPATVNLNTQTFTVGGASGSMTGVSHVIATGQADTILGGIDGEFQLATGAGDDHIQAYGQSLYGGQFRLNAGAGDDTVEINQFGYGSLDGGDGNDTLVGGGDLRFYNFRHFETLDNNNFLRVRTEQLRAIDHITNSNQFNNNIVTVELESSGTVDFGRLDTPGVNFIVKAFVAGTNVNGTAGDDEVQDLSNGLLDGVATPSTIAGNGGNDTIYNNSGIAVAGFNGNMADYTITQGGGLNPPWIVTDNRPGSPDGTDTLIYFDHTKPLLKFHDHTASIDEQLAYQADHTHLPAQIYNGKLELFGPDNFDYERMFPAQSKALHATLSGSTTYTVDYQGGTRVVFEGTGFSTSGEFSPTGGSVTNITVFNTSMPGSAILLARFSSEAATDHLFRVPFAADLLTGGSQLFHRLLSGNNLVIGSVNDDLIPITNGFDRVQGGPGGFDTLLFSARQDSISFTPGTGNDKGTFSFVDFVGDVVYDATIDASANLADRAASGENIVGQGLTPFIAGILHAIGAGDPHIVTFDGLDYLFQALGEFVLTKSTMVGDPFEIQVRAIPFPVVGMASVFQQVATRVGTDSVSFDASRPNVVLVDHQLVDLSSGPAQLNGGVLTLVAPGNWTIGYNTGETLHVTQIQTATSFLSITLDPGTQRAHGTLEGIWGDYDGDRTNDFQLADGSVLARPLSHATLYGMFADAWRVQQASSILDYDTGQTTDTFTNKQLPVTLSLSDIPQEILANAEALVSAAGITDQGLRNSALYDYIVTGDTAYIDSVASLQAQGVGTGEINAETSSLPSAMLGVIASQPEVVESSGGPTTVTFEIYRAGPAVGAAIADWQVLDPGDGYFDPADFVGGVLPSGQVTFTTGEARKTVTVSLLDGAVTLASEKLKVQISTTSGTPIFAPTAYADVINNAPASAAAAVAEFLKLGGPGALSHTGNQWTLDIGTLSENTAVADIRLALLNAAQRGANELSGSFETSGSSLIDIAGATTFLDLKAGNMKGGLSADVDSTKAGTFQTTLTLHASQSNDTGFSGVLGDFTLTVKANFTDVPDTIIGTSKGETLMGEDGVDFIFGRAGNDTLLGLGFNDQLHGEAGNDTLRGGDGVDQLDGGDGNDLLDGGAGADVLRGGAGNDQYVLANSTDTVIDTGGTADVIVSTISRTLVSYGAIEKLTLAGSLAINGTGNALANTIVGNAAPNTLNGASGADVLNGGAGADSLIGGVGIDRLTGGPGNDFFVFNAPLSAGNHDLISDFSNALGNNDTIKLENAIFKGMGSGALKSIYFFAGASAHDANDHIIYNKANGSLYYDSDGTGAHAQVLFAVISNHGSAGLTFRDFVLV